MSTKTKRKVLVLFLSLIILLIPLVVNFLANELK
jgi:hypothetical protein